MSIEITSPTQTQMANAIRALSMDAVEAANSGHPGMPMGMADVATVLFTKFLKYDPKAPKWPDRDRFVLSAGHGSMLIYALLYLTGYDSPTIGDIKNFRKLGSPCAGHPENFHLEGVETTTGPLGQGLATAVGMAMAERHLAARFGDDLVDHHTYVIVGDGCLMEGISHEAISLAGHLQLGRMIVLWDDNEISIDGPTSLSVSDDQKTRFIAQGWHVQSVDGHDPKAVEAAIAAAKIDPRPSMIACRTVIGYGAPTKGGTSGAHGSPLGKDEIAATRAALGWPYEPFDIPADILNAWRKAGERGAQARADWTARHAASGDSATFDSAISGTLPANLGAEINALKASISTAAKPVATRKASEMALDVVNRVVPITIGGSADLTGSNLTKTKDQAPMTAADFSGRYVYYGVREFGMSAAMNGLALHGGVIPYGGTFLVFTDYARSAIRLSALMKQRVVYVMSHDSIGLGEDGPTHQPIEHLASLRAMPNLYVFRPADAVETAEAWELALEATETPSVLALTRQNLPILRDNHTDENLSARGGYELRAASAPARVTLMATGSEVEIAVKARDLLEAAGIPARVVSMPCIELFDKQDKAYRDQVLGRGTLRVSIEAAATYGWDRYVGEDGMMFGIDSFGASAPIQDLYRHFGLEPQTIVDAIRKRV
ncbi:transketolase [Govanella unica]|uniref:Transketolase n=1 Tax=Govanella unica TaxID=2975056 RepID=A0A9X3TZM5_9PROT|nr:transketolase [Govania unica]MDA5194901.1 transketolase [Govania unica]